MSTANKTRLPRPYEKCIVGKCIVLSTSKNFCLDGCTDPDNCKGPFPQVGRTVQCGYCGSVGVERDFITSHYELRCPECDKNVQFPKRVEKDGKLFYEPSYRILGDEMR